jgi:hypothetical protein
MFDSATSEINGTPPSASLAAKHPTAKHLSTQQPTTDIQAASTGRPAGADLAPTPSSASDPASADPASASSPTSNPDPASAPSPTPHPDPTPPSSPMYDLDPVSAADPASLDEAASDDESVAGEKVAADDALPVQVSAWAGLSDYDLVEGLIADRARIGAIEADFLEKVAELYDRPAMIPLPVPPASESPKKTRQRVHPGLTREDLTEEELAAALHISDYEAHRLLQTALALTTRLPATMTALREGRLDLFRAHLVREAIQPLADDHFSIARKAKLSPETAEEVASTVAGLVEDKVFPGAGEKNPAKLRRALTRAINQIDPDFARRTAETNVRGRTVTHRTNTSDNTGDLYAHLGAAEAQGIYNTLDAYARLTRRQGSERSLSELRADAFTHLILHGHLPDGSTPVNPTPINTDNATVIPDIDPNTGDIPPQPESTESTRGTGATGEAGPATETCACTCGGTSDKPRHTTTANRTSRDPGTESGLRAHVQVTVSLNTLMGLDEEPAELHGHGPITAPTARDLAFEHGSTWQRLVTDPLTGQLLDYGRTTYRPPIGLQDFVRARDLTCRTPTCTRPASKCHLDHVIAWPAGSTSNTNLQAKCDHDHRLKHEGRWTHQLSTNPDHPPGTIILISPTGHPYLSHPHAYDEPKTQKQQPNPSTHNPATNTQPDDNEPPF